MFELDRTWKNVAMAYFKTIFQHFLDVGTNKKLSIKMVNIRAVIITHDFSDKKYDAWQRKVFSPLYLL